MTDLVKVEDFELSAELKEIKDAAREVIDASIGIPETRIDIVSDYELFMNNLAYILGLWESL